jgi:hypothetical protein
MAKRANTWTEDDVLSLPPGENDTFERKGASLLDLTLSNVKEDAVRDELAKQLSAFANTGGGQIIYGIANDGSVDSGGISRFVKGRQPTKEWLENLIPILTDFEIIGFNVYEILPKTTGSVLTANKSIYVVDIPDSERAPHQSKRDYRYYVRLAGNSLPASHRLVEDIRNRARHPKLNVHDLQVFRADPMGKFSWTKSRIQCQISVKLGLRNNGKVRATGSCLQVSASLPVSTGRFDTPDYFTRSGAEETVVFELKNALYPEMDIGLQFFFNITLDAEILGQSENLTMDGVELNDAIVSFTSFADSAPPRRQDFMLSAIDPGNMIAQSIKEGARKFRLSTQSSGRPSFGPWS